MKKVTIDNNSLAHTKWDCKYHIVFAPKYSDGSYYSLFSCLDTSKRKVHYELIFLKHAPLFRAY